MNIGRMWHRITIQKKTIAEDSEGYKTETWEDVTSCWAAAEGTPSSELPSSNAVQMQKNVQFSIHFRRDISQDMRVLFRGAAYEVIGLDDERYQNKYLLVQAQRLEQEKGARNG